MASSLPVSAGREVDPCVHCIHCVCILLLSIIVACTDHGSALLTLRSNQKSPSKATRPLSAIASLSPHPTEEEALRFFLAGTSPSLPLPVRIAIPGMETDEDLLQRLAAGGAID